MSRLEIHNTRLAHSHLGNASSNDFCDVAALEMPSCCFRNQAFDQRSLGRKRIREDLCNDQPEVTEGQAHRQPDNASAKVPWEPSLPILIQGCCADPILQHVFRKGPLVDCNRKQKSGKATDFSHAWKCRHRAAARLRPQARNWKAKFMASFL